MAKKKTKPEKIKKQESVKCAKCGLEFPESTLSSDQNEAFYVWDDKILCKDCLVMYGGVPGSSQIWEFPNDPSKTKSFDW
jgi:Pyruvate/2-oxoacid:ferredoxin oxidoreductase delta subunit